MEMDRFTRQHSILLAVAISEIIGDLIIHSSSTHKGILNLLKWMVSMNGRKYSFNMMRAICSSNRREHFFRGNYKV